MAKPHKNLGRFLGIRGTISVSKAFSDSLVGALSDKYLLCRDFGLFFCSMWTWVVSALNFSF